MLYGDIVIINRNTGQATPSSAIKSPSTPRADNKVVAVRRGTRHRKEPDRFCQSLTFVPNKTPKQQVKEKLRKNNLKKINTVSKTKMTYSNKKMKISQQTHTHNKVWTRDSINYKPYKNNPRYNGFAEKNAWLKKFRKLQTDPEFQARSRALVENFKKNYTPPEPWHPDMQQYTNLLVSGVQISISKLKKSKATLPPSENQITQQDIDEIMDKVHNDIKILCVNAFPFGTTIPMLAGKTDRTYNKDEYQTVGLVMDYLLPASDKRYILEKLGELEEIVARPDSGMDVDSESPLDNPFNIDYDNDESFDTLITQADMDAAAGMAPDEIKKLEEELRALGYDIDNNCELPELEEDPDVVEDLEASEVTKGPEASVVPKLGKKRAASGITRRFKKAIGRVRRTSVKKLVPKMPKVFKSRETKKPKTPKNPKKPKKPKSKSQKGGHKRAKHRTQKRHINSATKSCKTKKLYGGHCPSHNCVI